jgi:hypothetical protein
VSGLLGDVAYVHQARSRCLRCCPGVTVVALDRPSHRARGGHDLLIRSYLRGRSSPFGTVCDIGRVSAHCSGKSEEPESRTSAWLPAWLPATLDAWHVGALVLVTTTTYVPRLAWKMRPERAGWASVGRVGMPESCRAVPPVAARYPSLLVDFLIVNVSPRIDSRVFQTH